MLVHAIIPHVQGAVFADKPSVTLHGGESAHLSIAAVQNRPDVIVHPALPQMHGPALLVIPLIFVQSVATKQMHV
jgi:hypothetical protein